MIRYLATSCRPMSGEPIRMLHVGPMAQCSPVPYYTENTSMGSHHHDRNKEICEHEFVISNSTQNPHVQPSHSANSLPFANLCQIWQLDISAASAPNKQVAQVTVILVESLLDVL